MGTLEGNHSELRICLGSVACPNSELEHIDMSMQNAQHTSELTAHDVALVAEQPKERGDAAVNVEGGFSKQLPWELDRQYSSLILKGLAGDATGLQGTPDVTVGSQDVVTPGKNISGERSLLLHAASEDSVPPSETYEVPRTATASLSSPSQAHPTKMLSEDKDAEPMSGSSLSRRTEAQSVENLLEAKHAEPLSGASLSRRSEALSVEIPVEDKDAQPMSGIATASLSSHNEGSPADTHLEEQDAEPINWDDLRAQLAKEYFREGENDDYEARLQEAVFVLHEAQSQGISLSTILEEFGIDKFGDVQAALDKINGDHKTIQFLTKTLQELGFHKIDPVQAALAKLNRDKKAILVCIEGMFKEMRGRVFHNEIRLGGKGSDRPVLLVPEKMKMGCEDVRQVFGEKHWNLSAPDLVATFDAGALHPAALTTRKHREHRALKDVRDAAYAMVGRFDDPRCKQESVDDSQADELIPTDARERQRRNYMDQVLMDRLQEIFSELLDASCMSANWIMIDRRTPTSSSPTAELLLEQNIASAESRKPLVLVMDSLTRWRHFKPSREVIKTLLVIGDIVSTSHNAEGSGSTCDVPNLYRLQDFESWERFHFSSDEHFFRAIRGGAATKQLRDEGNRRLPRFPEPQVILTDEDGCPRKTSDMRPLVTPQLKWFYHYRQYLYQSGSHYVLFEDGETSGFPLGDCPSVRFCAHGSNLDFDRMVDSFRTCTSMVLLQNTGGVTQAFVGLFQELLRIHDNKESFELEKILMKLQDFSIVSSDLWVKRFGPNVVQTMRRLVERAPDQLRTSVAIVDFLNDNPEVVVEKASMCFRAGREKLPELGLGTAHDDVLVQAWHASLVFYHNAQVFRFWGDFWFYMSLIVSVFSTLLVLLWGSQSLRPILFENPSPGAEYAGLCVDLLLTGMPILATGIGGIMSVRRYLQKWAALHFGAHAIVSEIYKFRILACEYDVYVSFENDAGGDRKVSKPRDIFLQRFNAIYAATVQQLGTDALAHPTSIGPMPRADGDARESLMKAVKKLVTLQLYQDCRVVGESRMSRLWQALHKKTRKQAKVKPLGQGSQPFPVQVSVVPESAAESGQVGPQESSWIDRYLGPMTVEQYMEHRVKPQIVHQKRYVPVMARKLRALDILGITFNALGTALVAFDRDSFGLKSWVALTAILASAITSASQHQLLQQRITSYNGSIQNLEGMFNYMASVSIIVRRSPNSRRLCVGMVEKSCLDPITAWTGVSSMVIGESGSEDTKEEGDAKKV